MKNAEKRPALIMICPSRGHPKAAHALFDSFMDTRTTDDVRLHFALDEDDPSYEKYPPGKGQYPSHSPVQALNLAFARYVVPNDSRYVGSMCDEQRFITKGWDTAILGALDEMGGGLAYPNDLIDPGALPAACFMSTAIAKAVGWFAHPDMQVNYFDNVWKALGEGVGKIRYLDDVVVQHLSMPQTTKPSPRTFNDNQLAIQRDRDTFALWSRWQAPLDVAKARAALGIA